MTSGRTSGSRWPLLRRRPDPTSRYTESHQGRGADYDRGFDDLPMRALVWQLEQQVLADLLATAAEAAPPRRVLDVACGTGRITEVLARLLPEAEVTGLDVAESMLDRARRRVPRASFALADVRDLEAVVEPASVDLVSAFRFFPNADAALARAATSSMAQVLRPGATLLVNNHRNFWSPSYVARRARGRSGAPGARNRDVVGPFLELGFDTVARRSLGVVPHSDARAYLLPARVAAAVERRHLASGLSARHTAGADTVWLLRKPG